MFPVGTFKIDRPLIAGNPREPDAVALLREPVFRPDCYSKSGG